MIRPLAGLFGPLLLIASLWLAVGGAVRARAPSVPAILFAARSPDPGGRLPGVGPEGRTLRTGGRLLVRQEDGRVRPFISAGHPGPHEALFDVQDPAVSFDGGTVVFSGTTGPDAPWRLWIAGADGSNARPIDVGDPSPGEGSGPATAAVTSADGAPDDFDPTFLPDGRIVFASTRFTQRAQVGGGPVSNLFVVRADGTGLARVTTERNGAEEPSVDPLSGRIVYARWWVSRFLPASGAEPWSVTTERSGALAAEPVDIWHALIAAPDGDGARLAGGFPRVRHQTMAYQPILLPDSSLVGVQAEPGSLLGGSGGLPIPHRLLVYPGGFAPPRLVADAALSPALLPDGRLLWSAPGPGGDRALFVSERPLLTDTPVRAVRLVDTPGLDDLDGAVLAPRPAPPSLAALMPPPAHAHPFTTEEELRGTPDTFRFDCLNVFANGPVDGAFPDAPKLAPNLRIRFFATLDRPGAAAGDTLVLVREAPLTARGGVHEHELPGDTPMFEQLIDAEGRVLVGSHGPAHVPGFNAARAGTGTKCVGCHVGHSALPVSRNYDRGTWTNIAPSADLGSPSRGAGNRPADSAARALVDRRARGPEHVAWEISPPDTVRFQLTWPFPVEVREVILYASRVALPEASGDSIFRIELNLRLSGQVVHSTTLTLSPHDTTTRVPVPAVAIQELVLAVHTASGTVPGVTAVGMREIEVVGRLTDRFPPGSP
jgi:hypothetical protein